MGTEKLKKQFKERLKRQGKWKPAPEAVKAEPDYIPREEAEKMLGIEPTLVMAETEEGKITVEELRAIARDKGISPWGKKRAELLEVLKDEL